jgi:pimeloyl-ACP methyl ester carboxylesterase
MTGAEHRDSESTGSAAAGTSLFVTAQDGLKLHVRCYGARTAPDAPVVCLPGLARTEADFHELATALARDPASPRRVVALDYRGRGRSGFDRNPRNYSFPVELNDVVAVLTALDVGPAIFVGTSRGGILTMMLAALRPGAIAAAVLNDIGPVVEPKGLLRIKGYVGKLPQPKTLAEGADILRRLFEAQFPKVTAEQWLVAAGRTWQERKGRLQPTYDVRLAKILQGVDLERSLPALWDQFDALERVPLMVIRGAHSDILTPETVAAMRSRHAGMEVMEVADQGHAPLLAEPDTIGRIADFIARAARSRSIH